MAHAWPEAERYLLASARFGTRPGLHRMRELLARLGDPHLAVPHVVHVGGTNGKGSVAASLDAVLRAAGLRVARYTSPHLVHFRERIVVDGNPIPAPELARLLLDEVRPAAEAVARTTGEAPVTFELLTAAMYLWCRERRVDWLVQEVGLGGRLDSTNLVPRPEVVVITNVSLDHTDRLGDTVEAIAAEKAGIVKPGAPVVTAAAGSALEVIAREARRRGARLVVVSPAGPDQPGAARAGAAAPPDSAPTYAYEPTALTEEGSAFRLRDPAGRVRRLSTSLLGEHQVANAALAAAAADVLAAAHPETVGPAIRKALAGGLAATRWPGRMQLVDGEPPLLLDGAHNPAGMEALRRSVELLFPGRPVVLLAAATGDRDPAQLFRPWAGIPAACAAVTPGGPRALPADRLARGLAAAGLPAVPFENLDEGLDFARRAARRAGRGALVVACGSLYLVGALLARLPEAAGNLCSPSE